MRIPYDLPVELFTDIISYVIQVHPRPNDVLAVNAAFHDVGVVLLYTRLCFRSVRQLSLFAAVSSPTPVPPRHVEVTLSGGTAAFTVFRDLAEAFKRCTGATKVSHDTSAGSQLPLSLESLSLCLNSHSSNPYLYHIYNALKLVNPRRFVWLGPDPSHHFSTAIVPTATLYLFGAMSTWSNVEHITLTNISFLSDITLLAGGGNLGKVTDPTLFPPLPRLRLFYIGQATRLLPSTIARMVFQSGQDQLEQVRVVDAYKESIWGSRLRRRDIEKAALSLPLNMSPEAIRVRVKRLVKCEAKTERIMGGDRVEGTSELE